MSISSKRPHGCYLTLCIYVVSLACSISARQVSMEFPQLKISTWKSQTSHWKAKANFSLHRSVCTVYVFVLWFPLVSDCTPKVIWRSRSNHRHLKSCKAILDEITNNYARYQNSSFTPSYLTRKLIERPTYTCVFYVYTCYTLQRERERERERDSTCTRM